MVSHFQGKENFVSFQGKNGPLMRSPWGFKPTGQSGKMVSTMLPHMAQHVDDIAFFHGMQSKTNTHGPGCVFVNTGHPTEGFPSAGAWISYALGSMADDLPTYVAIPDIRGEPPNGKANWSNGFLPAKHQAITMAAHRPIRNLRQPEQVSDAEEQETRKALKFLNQQHANMRPEESDLQARMNSYELAARMQLSAPEVSDFKSEPQHIHQLYGTDSQNNLKASYAQNCLLAPLPGSSGLSRLLHYRIYRVADSILSGSRCTAYRHDHLGWDFHTFLGKRRSGSKSTEYNPHRPGHFPHLLFSGIPP